MIAQCNDDRMPRRCAEKFEEISRSLAQIERIAADVDVLRKAIVGNGEVDGSLAFRLRRLEELLHDRKSRRRQWGQRAWKIAMGAALVLLGWLLKSN